MGRLVTKSELAREMNVSAARVSQYLAEGKLHGAAIVGEGTRAKIDADLAREQLRATLDLSQRLGLNGMTTRLDAPAAQPAATDPVPGPSKLPQPGYSSVEERIKAERLAQEEIRTRRAKAEEQAEIGRYVLADSARSEAGQIAARMMTFFESAMPEISGAFAARFAISSRDALHLLRSEFTRIRKDKARDIAAHVALEPDTVADDADRVDPVEA